MRTTDGRIPGYGETREYVYVRVAYRKMCPICGQEIALSEFDRHTVLEFRFMFPVIRPDGSVYIDATGIESHKVSSTLQKGF